MSRLCSSLRRRRRRCSLPSLPRCRALQRCGWEDVQRTPAPSAHREPEAALQPSGDGAGPGPLLCSAGMQPSIPAGFPHCWPSSLTPTYGPHTHRDRLGYPDPKTPAGIVVWLFSKAAWKSPILYRSPNQACAGSERVKSTAICSYISLLKS